MFINGVTNEVVAQRFILEVLLTAKYLSRVKTTWGDSLSKGEGLTSHYALPRPRTWRNREEHSAVSEGIAASWTKKERGESEFDHIFTEYLHN